MQAQYGVARARTATSPKRRDQWPRRRVDFDLDTQEHRRRPHPTRLPSQSVLNLLWLRKSRRSSRAARSRRGLPNHLQRHSPMNLQLPHQLGDGAHPKLVTIDFVARWWSNPYFKERRILHRRRDSSRATGLNPYQRF